MKEWIGVTDWEIFRDLAYYDLWAVRPVGERLWGRCFHVQSKEEAEGLRDLLSSKPLPAPPETN